MIWVVSGDAGSSSWTNWLIYSFLQKFWTTLQWEPFAEVMFHVRKGMHVVTYFGFALLLLRALRTQFETAPLGRLAVVAVVIAAALGAADEIHQSMVPSRTGSPWDVLLDTTGAVLAAILTVLWSRRKRAVVAEVATVPGD